MSGRSHRRLAVLAVVVILASAPVVAEVRDSRERRVADARSRDLVDDVVAQRVAPGDFDGDGVRDARDACPRRPETDNGFRDDDGCPDVVATTGAS